MTLAVPRIRHYLQTFAFERLFIEELGWDRHSTRLAVQVEEQTYILTAFAEKRGVQIYICQPGSDGKIPDYPTRRKIEKQVTKAAFEHLIVFIDADKTAQVWQWVSRQPGQPTAYREHHYHPHYQSGDSLIQKLESITFKLSEEEGLTLTGVVFRLHDAFDRDRVTKKFYDYFKKEQTTFLGFIKGISDQGDREWYASLMLNRLMFVYFIQRKGFLDGDVEYLRNRLKMVQERNGKDNFLTFYRYFLVRLFHEGFAQQPAQRTPELEELIGKVPYLDGGLFELHELEEKHPDIDVPDKAFERLLGFFDQYEWYLDARPLQNDKEINPDVLGYIFEKYINQKQMGAYYTKEDITGYISKNTIIPYLFDAAEKKCAIAFQPGSALWRLLQDDPDRYIYPAVRKGVVDETGDVIPLPAEIEKGIKDVSQRGGWNHPANPDYALPTEIWREHVARRQRCLELREKLKAGEIHQINDLITYNLDIRQFVEDVITGSEGPELLRAFYKAISTITVLDPTCGSGAFLFAALNILEPLYEACLDRMQGFVDDLDRSNVRHRPEKFSDFCNTLADIERHPNRRYFILKSIIVNNLYGVDIMQEAVEICKLRLFLKLVAQVDKVKHLEPLPDIDFNIRAGNTLVGFATLDDVKTTLEGKLPFYKDQVGCILEEAEIVERAFQRFHEMQIEQNMDAGEFASAKKELHRRLKELTTELNRYMAIEYGINPDNVNEYIPWIEGHQPFHWFAEFFGIMRQGGFDAVIGNPPYVSYAKIRKHYDVSQNIYKTQRCSNLYALVTERILQLNQIQGYFGVILPLSSTNANGNSSLQKRLRDVRLLYISHFAVRPSKLFTGVDMNLTVICGSNNSKGVYGYHTTSFHRWYSEYRPFLFPLIKYIKNAIKVKNSAFPKFGSELENSIWIKLSCKQTKIINYVAEKPDTRLSFHGFGRYWRKCIKEKISDNYQEFAIPNRLSPFVICLLNSQLAYWYWIVISDCYRFTKTDAFDLAVPSSAEDRAYYQLSEDLLKCYEKNSIVQKKVARNGLVTYEKQYFPVKCKYIIDDIDKQLANHFGFTGEEFDYITNYDIKFRM